MDRFLFARTDLNETDKGGCKNSERENSFAFNFAWKREAENVNRKNFQTETIQLPGNEKVSSEIFRSRPLNATFTYHLIKLIQKMSHPHSICEQKHISRSNVR